MADPATKSITIFFYGEGEGSAAKQLADAERAAHNAGLTRDAARFDGVAERADKAIILPGVRGHHANAIRAAYGDLVAGMDQAPAPLAPKVMPIKEHRGMGKWHIMLGEKEISGPHTRSEIDAELMRTTAQYVGRNKTVS